MSTIVIPGISDNSITNSLLRDSAALSVIGRSANSSGDPADVAGTTDQVLRVSAGDVLGFGTVATEGIANNAVEYAKWQQLAGFSIAAKSTTGTGNAADLTAAINTVLGREGADLVFAQVTAAQIATNAIQTVKIQNNAVDDSKLRNSVGFSVIGKFDSGTSDPADIVAGTNAVLGRQGADLVFSQVATAQIAAGAADNTIIRDSAGFSVIGKLDTGSGSVADLVAGSDSVLGRDGSGNLAFATVKTNQIAAAAITHVRYQDVAANTVIANATGSTTSVTAVAVGANTVLGRVGSNIVAATLVNAQITTGTIGLDKIVDATASSRLLGSSATGSGNPYSELTVGSGLQISGSELSATGGGGGGDALTEAIVQSHTFSVGDVVDHDGTKFVDADRDDAATSDVMGVVNAVADASNFTITYAGKITTLTGLTIGTQYFLSSALGAAQDTEPPEGEIIAPVYYALTATTAIVNIQRPIQVTEIGGFAEEIVTLSATVNTSSESFQDITGLAINMLASADYLVEVWLPYNVPGITDGIHVALNGPTGLVDLSLLTTNGASGIEQSQDGYDFADTEHTNSIFAGDGNLVVMRGIVRNGTTAGDLQVRFASEAANSTTINIGATMKMRRVN